MHKAFIAIALSGVVSAITEAESSFFAYITEYGKSYPTLEEYQLRFENFAQAHQEIEEHNATESDYKLGHNQMSDWTRDEYLAILTHQPMDQAEFEANLEYVPETLEASRAIDWRSKGKVQSIKDQKQCGSCWAFSSVSALESAYAVKHNKLYSFAEQQLVDCEPKSNGCNGGLQQYAYKYYQTHGAIEEKNYAYTARTQSCKYSSKSHTSIETKGYKSVSANNPSQMKAALSSQPLSVSIEADKSAFSRYKSGIFNDSSCGTRLDHATNVVGWGSSGSKDYWIMRNSWGRSWGESGYMRLEIQDGHGVCGIQKEPQYPIV